MGFVFQGFVTPAEIFTFFKEIHVMWVNMGEYADLAIYYVVDEVLDMVKPKTTTLITVEDLEVSGMSGIFFTMLADVKLFQNHNYREVGPPQQRQQHRQARVPHMGRPGQHCCLSPNLAARLAARPLLASSKALCLSCWLAGWMRAPELSFTKRKAEGQTQGHQCTARHDTGNKLHGDACMVLDDRSVTGCMAALRRLLVVLPDGLPTYDLACPVPAPSQHQASTKARAITPTCMACMRAGSRPGIPQSRQGTPQQHTHSAQVWPVSLETCAAGSQPAPGYIVEGGCWLTTACHAQHRHHAQRQCSDLATATGTKHQTLSGCGPAEKGPERDLQAWHSVANAVKQAALAANRQLIATMSQVQAAGPRASGRTGSRSEGRQGSRPAGQQFGKAAEQ
ncbi:hypothetical protein V8C86DRAFT_2439514 [Haematococcus lacustris]